MRAMRRGIRPVRLRAAGAACLAAGLLLLAAPPRAAAQPRQKDAYLQRFLGRPAPPFSLKDVRGREVRLSEHKGKVVLLNFWYSACFPCREETPDLIRLYNTHKERGLVILGINMDTILVPADDGGMLQRFMQDFDIPYPTLIADQKMYNDYGRAPIAPITLLIDRKGAIAQVFWGAYSFSMYESALRPYLEAASP